MLLRLACLGVTIIFALLRPPTPSDHLKHPEILVPRHHTAVLQRQLGDQRVRLQPADRALIAALFAPLPRRVPPRPRPLIHPDTILRWHRDLLARRHATLSRPRRRGQPPTPRSIRASVLRPARESGWPERTATGLPAHPRRTAHPRDHRRRHRVGKPARGRDRSRTGQISDDPRGIPALASPRVLAADFIETITLSGTRRYLLAVIEHATRRIRVPGAAAHPTAAGVTQTARNLVTDPQHAGQQRGT